MNVSNRGYLYFVRLSGKIILLFCVFSYVYQIHYKIFPVTFSVILGLFGILYNFFINRGLFKIKWCNFYVFCGFYLVIISLIISAVVNGTNDYTFLQFGIVNLLNVYSFYTISILFKILYKDISFELIVKYYIASALLQLIISLVMFLDVDKMVCFTDLLKYTSLAETKLIEEMGARLIGFGTQFFQSGIIHGMILLLLVFYADKKKCMLYEKVFLCFVFCLISIVGMMMARTTLVGILMAIAFVIFKSNMWKLKIKISSIKLVLSMFVVLCAFSLFVMNFSYEVKTSLLVAYDFGFELINSYTQTGQLETASTNAMFRMYIFPSLFKTWVIGDGLWMDSFGRFYMHTDIGFIRMIFYFGIVGLISFIVFQSVSIFAVYRNNKYLGKIPFILIFVYFFVLNLKGFTDLFYLIIPFCYCSSFTLKHRY